MRKKERYEKVIAWFQENVPVAETELHYNNPYELLIAVILSAQCTDKRVNIITPPLYRDFPTPEALAATTPEVVFEYIRSVSYPNNKAKHLVGMAKMLVNEFNSQVPDNMEDLIKLPGVGRKTANVIQSVVFHKAATAADFQAAMVNVEKNLGNSYTANDVKGNEITANKAGVYAIKATTTDTANYAYSPMAAFVSFKPYTTAPTTLDNATVNAKRTTIKIEKTSSETDGVVEINKEVEYTVTTNVPYISDNVADKDVKYTITDKITGAEYSAKNGTLDVTVILGDGEAAKTETRQVTVKTETEPAGQSFVLDLSDIAKNRNNATIKRKLFPILVAKIQEEKMKEWVKCYTSDVLINCCVCKR